MRFPAALMRHLHPLKSFFLVGLLLVLDAFPVWSMWEVYQWTDPNGTIHFTDNWFAIPETVRNSPELIVRKMLPDPEPVADNRTPLETGVQPSEESAVPTGGAPLPLAAGIPYVVEYMPQSLTTIVVVPSTGYTEYRGKPRPFRRRVHKRDFPRVEFGSNRYIHPSARTGTPRLAIHPEAPASVIRHRRRN